MSIWKGLPLKGTRPPSGGRCAYALPSPIPYPNQEGFLNLLVEEGQERVLHAWEDSSS